MFRACIYFFFYLCLVLLICSCSDKYLTFKDQYQFKSQDGKPDYSILNYWAAHPGKHDPADSIPAPLRNTRADTSVDVFFIHPTTYTTKLKNLNASIDDGYLNAKTDYSTILYQASVFNLDCRVFAPRYRQAHISCFYMKDKVKADSAFEIAYEDLKTAFEYYLEHFNNGRPIIIAGHSQGGKMTERLLKDFFENKPLQKQLVVAYALGWPVPKEYFTVMKMCNDSVETGCLCSWRTFRKGYKPSYIKKENGNSFVTNPLTWTTDEKYASRKMNYGSVLTKFNKIYNHTTDAQIKDGIIWVKRPRFPWSFLYLSKNYHVGDINLYYLNLQQNIRTRIAAYIKRSNHN